MNISQAEYTHTHTHAKCGLLFKKFHWPTLIYLKGGKYQFVKLCVWIKCKSPSCARFFATPWTAAHQALLSMNFPGKNTREGCHFLLQRIFPTQGSNPGFPHCRQMLYHLSHQGSPGKLYFRCVHRKGALRASYSSILYLLLCDQRSLMLIVIVLWARTCAHIRWQT